MSQSEDSTSDSKREMLRHTVATLAYRGAKTIAGAPDSFAALRIGDATRTPLEILAHIGDVLSWAFHMAKGEHVWQESEKLEWDQQVMRFFRALKDFDSYLASDEPLGFPAEKLFQGPVADSLTHVGQLALLRRVAGAPIRGENYVKAEIVAGQVGTEQSVNRFEFE